MDFDDTPEAAAFRAEAIRIAGGSNEVQRNIMAERVLGLPREMQADRDLPLRSLGRSAS